MLLETMVKDSIHKYHCLKSVRIRSSSGPYTVQIREKTAQKNSEYVRFLQILSELVLFR